MLHPSADRGVHARFLHMVLNFIHNFLDKGLPGILAQVYLFHQIIINIRLQEFK